MEIEELRRDVARLERMMIEHDARMLTFLSAIKDASKVQAEAAARSEHNAALINGHLRTISKNTDKVVNGDGIGRLTWWLSGAVVVAALGNKALDVLLAWLGRIGG